jgi:hypothetical protein
MDGMKEVPVTAAEAEARPIRSLIPARLDRLSWSPFHARMVRGLVEVFLGVSAAGKSLEQVTKPLTSVAGRAAATAAAPTAA